MRDYGKIFTSIWNSKKFRGIDDDARLIYLYLHTCPHINSTGCFVLKDLYAAADLNWDVERYRKGIDTLVETLLIGFDASENVLRIVNYLKFDPFMNKNHAKGAIKLALSLPDCEQKTLVLNDMVENKYAFDDVDLLNGIERVSKGYRTPEPEPEPGPLPAPNTIKPIIKDSSEKKKIEKVSVVFEAERWFSQAEVDNLENLNNFVNVTRKLNSDEFRLWCFTTNPAQPKLAATNALKKEQSSAVAMKAIQDRPKTDPASNGLLASKLVTSTKTEPPPADRAPTSSLLDSPLVKDAEA